VSACPVCRAGFRGVATCSRCGADLAPLMEIAARAWRMRESARQSLAAGDFESAARQAEAAQALEATPEGQGIAAVARVMEAIG
jgi:predicted amidophosphoribosyltransferase